MSFDLNYKVELHKASKEIFDKFIKDNLEKKEVSQKEVFELLAKGSVVLSTLKLNTNKKLDEEQQKQFLKIIFDTLVKNESNDFEAIEKINEIINLVYDLKNGRIKVDLGQGGLGLLCCKKVMIDIEK